MTEDTKKPAAKSFIQLAEELHERREREADEALAAMSREEIAEAAKRSPEGKGAWQRSPYAG